MSEKRKLYRILRGTYSRREGDEVTVKDSLGRTLTKERPHVIYQAKTPGNQNAKDEVYMSDLEAFRFGLDRLKPLSARNVKTLDVPAATDDEDASPPQGDHSEVAQALIAAGEEASGKKAIDAWRQQVINSEILDDVPTKKADILDALKAIVAEAEGEAE